MEKVSVIVPVYNGEKYVQRCADSILNQDYPELELILVDDGSRDRSWEILQAIAAGDTRVKAIHQENGGVSAARNRALAEATGAYLQFADVDDWLPMDATKLLVRELEATGAELVVADFYRVVDDNVSQKGSYVAEDRLRFDYSYGKPLTLTEWQQIENLVCQAICDNYEVKTEIMNLDAAKKSGAIALFDEKYEDDVRVVSMGDFSKELCGGTHVARTGDIGTFVITNDESVASGIRRIEARVGMDAVEYDQKIKRMVAKICKLMKADNKSIAEKAEQLAQRSRDLEKANEQLNEKVVSLESAELARKTVDINGAAYVGAIVPGYSPKDLRIAADCLKVRLKSCVIALGSTDADGKVSILTAVSSDLTSKVKAGDLIKAIAPLVDGRGGGRPDMAQAGGSKAEGLPAAIAESEKFLKEHL